MNLTETANTIGVKRDTLAKWVSEGMAKATKNGRIYQFSDEEVERLKSEVVPNSNSNSPRIPHQSLLGLIVTNSKQWTLEYLILQLKEVCTKVKVIVDNDAPDAQAIGNFACDLGVNTVTYMTVGTHLENALQDAYNNQSEQWILRVDDDELLSAQLANNLHSILRYADTHNIDFFRIARAHIASLNPYNYYEGGIIADPATNGALWTDFFPNLQLRLFRNGHIEQPRTLFSKPVTKGRGGIVDRRPILHMNLLKPLDERKRLIQHYSNILGRVDVRTAIHAPEVYPQVVPVDCPYPIFEVGIPDQGTPELVSRSSLAPKIGRRRS